MAETAPLSSATRALRDNLAQLGARYHRAGWLMGTSGNLSARTPTPGGDRIVMTASGRDKGNLTPDDFVELDPAGHLLAAGTDAQPSAEASIHLALYRAHPSATFALHVHTVASTLAISDTSSTSAIHHITFQHLELIKGWGLWDEHATAALPIFPNWPHVPKIAQEIATYYRAPDASPVPALLIATHGITAWGIDAFTANRHLEVTEFLCQVALARRSLPRSP